ncbi:exopolysaccharide Pel transporter PelG [Cohnella caldifontis]|uniref:exopolysaccharide Pel transporter PelG n=1 Tax=Cohnella caldifontis TaxID=3027471 RepID=UPI0023EB900E|nr:exopolysaccharide Pel transporter PelG [Cohnella sp. YIM B05605]
MAGVGFELRKLFRDQGIVHTFKAYAYSSLTTVGPMFVCMLMILFLQTLLAHNGASYPDRELFLATVVYAFVFSVLVTGGLSMLLTRFLSDRMFEKKYEHLLSSYYGAIGVCLPIGAVAAWLFLRHVQAGSAFKAAAYLLFAELIVVWIQSVHLSALKDYKRIVRNFSFGAGFAIVGTWAWFRFTPYDNALSAVCWIDLGLLIIVGLTARHFAGFFPPRSSRLYWSFLSYLNKYPSLLLIGTFLYAGVYVHSFVYWFSPDFGESVASAYRISSYYDLPVFYAYLSVVPTLVTFVVSVETSFYDKFRDYYTKIISSGTLQEITRAKQEMQRTLMQEVSFVMEVQLLFTVVSLAVGIKALPAIGLTMEQLDIFKILVLGYYAFIVAFVLLLLMLYFDDRRGVAWISGGFVLLNAGLTLWTMRHGQHGLGMFIASFIALVVALVRLRLYVRNIDYYTFCAQPLVVVEKKPFWRRRFGKKGAAAVMMLGLVLLSACTSGQEPEASVPVDLSSAPSVTDTNHFVEDKRIYERDDDLSVDTLYLTVLSGKDGDGDEDDIDPVTWYAMNRIQSKMEEGELPVIAQEGAPGGKGPQPGLFQFGATKANATISLRGNTSRYASQRSYNIKLYDSAGLWNDQKIINLNKHIYDPTRIRNKLSFDLFETLPDIGSLRTQFVHVYVRDLSEKGMDRGFEDYGLFTHVEQPNKNFLKTHWLDPNGQLYKAIMFEFYRYPDELKSENDPGYDPAAFETRLEIRGREEHGKLLQMLDDLNDMSIPIDDVMQKHFDLDNYLTWMAANILMDNMDTNASNFLLYSPLNSDKWYFLPWDYDGGWELQRNLGSISPYASGISNYWGSVLANRFFRTQEHVDLLKNKIDELYDSTFNGSLETKIADYRRIVEPYLDSKPDRSFLPDSVDRLYQDYAELSKVPLRSIERFNEDLQRPKPFFMGEFVQSGNTGHFVWDPSFDLQKDELSYDWSLAKDPGFTRIVQEKQNLKGTSYDIGGLTPGTYYWKVVVRDSQGHEQQSFDQLIDDEGEPHYGIRKIEVK